MSANPLRYESVENRPLRDLLAMQNARVLRTLASRRSLLRPGDAGWDDAPAGSPAFHPVPPTSAGPMPPLLYQTWKSHDDLPPNYAHWRASFARHNPGWTLLLWDDADNRALVADEFPALLPAYDSLPTEIYRVDLVRPLFLFRYGGLYADLDTECLAPLDPMRIGHDVLLGRLGTEPGFRHSVPNAIMASRPLEAFWLHYVQTILDGLVGREAGELMRLGPEDVTGPVALKRAVDAWHRDPAAALEHAAALIDALPAALHDEVRHGRVEVLPSESWYPFDWNNKIHARLRRRLMRERGVLRPSVAARLFPESTMVTYWTAGWKRD